MKPVKQDDGNMAKQVLDTGDVVFYVTKIETPIEQESEAETIDL